jgi:hypothetical protein
MREERWTQNRGGARLFTLAAAAGAAARLGERRVRGRRSSCERCRRKARMKRARGRCPPASGGGSKHRL